MLGFMYYQRLPAWKKLPELDSLLDLPHPPKDLFYQGKWDPKLFKNCVAVIGSRRMTEYGRRVIEKIIPRLVFEKKTIVSGFMYGVDQYAHRVCIENGGKTIAVLGWGITKKLEREDAGLAKAIISSGGLLISEWEDQEATLWTFPVRNRIVAALSSDVIVVEAAIKSGSLITAHIARKLKRNLWAVPGPITSRMSFGTNSLIHDGLATMWVDDVPAAKKANRDPLLAMLTDEELTANEIARKVGGSVSDIGAKLSLLMLTGQLIERGGKYRVNQN